jgi:TolB-like protein/lipoprotein NlpI
LLLLAIGFPVALILAWAFELTPSGMRRDSGDETPRPAGRRPMDYIVVTTLALALVYFAADKFLISENGGAAPPGASVAVLPFANLSQNPSNDPFVNGIHDDLLTQLSRIGSLSVTSRTSVLQYRDTTKPMPVIADELGVATILEAGVQRLGSSVRINVQLIDAAKDEHIWAETYDRELTAANVFEIQSEIAAAITGALQAALTPDERLRLEKIPTHSIAALDSYFVGKQLLEERTRESLTAAAEYFETVVELDPEFALGWSGLADAYMLLPEYSSTIDRELVETKARRAVQVALQLDPDLPEVLATQAWYELRFYDWEKAETIFRNALAVAPDNTNVLHWLSHVLAFQGRFDEALEVARRTVAIEPASRIMRTHLAYILTDAGQFEESAALMNEIRDEHPDYSVLRRNYYLHELRANNPHQAAQAFAEFVEAVGGDVDAAREIGDMFIAFAESGAVGNLTDDLITRTQLGSEDLAQVLAFVGDAEGTIAALQAAAAENSGSRSVFSMKINPAYDFIRDDPRFQALLRQVGLAD